MDPLLLANVFENSLILSSHNDEEFTLKMGDDSSEDSDVEEFPFDGFPFEHWRHVFRYLPRERQNRLLELERERMRERARLQIIHRRASRLQHYHLPHQASHFCDFCQIRDSFLQINPQHRFEPHSLKQMILLRYGYKLFYEKISSKVKYSLFSVVSARRSDQSSSHDSGDRHRIVNGPGIPWQVDGSLRIRPDERPRRIRNRIAERYFSETNVVEPRSIPRIQYNERFWPPLSIQAEDFQEVPCASFIFRVLRRAHPEPINVDARTNTTDDPSENVIALEDESDTNQQRAQHQGSSARLTDNEIENLLSDESLTLSNDLLRMLQQIVRELSDFCQYISKMIDKKVLCDELRQNWFRCFLNHLHWLPDNRRMAIDRKATALMILRVFEYFCTYHELSSSTGIEFILAAENMLEEEARRIFPRLDSAVHHLLDDMQYERDIAGATTDAIVSSKSVRKLSPLVYYWAAVCSNCQNRIQSSIRGIIHYCITENVSRSGRVSNFSQMNDPMDLLRHFFPLMRDSKNFARHRDHFFHMAIQAGNIPAVRYFLTEVVASDMTIARQMINATSCCGSKNSFYALNACLLQEKDIDADEIEADDQPCTSRQAEERFNRRADVTCDIFAYLWSFLTEEERNNATLAEHASLFVRSVSLGLFRIAQTIWNSAGKNQRFVIMFQGGCEAFRSACAKGYMDIVSMIWSSLNEDEKKQILTVYQNDAFLSAVANNHLHIVSYLLNNVKSSTKAWLIETASKRAVDACILYNCPIILYVLKHEMPKHEYLYLVLSDNKAILNAILKKGNVEMDEKFSGDVKMKPPGRPEGQEDGEQYWRSEAIWLLQESRFYEDSKPINPAADQNAANHTREDQSHRGRKYDDDDAAIGDDENEEDDDESSSVEDFADEYCMYDGMRVRRNKKRLLKENLGT